jgi:hypothetical protein
MPSSTARDSRCDRPFQWGASPPAPPARIRQAEATEVRLHSRRRDHCGRQPSREQVKRRGYRAPQLVDDHAAAKSASAAGSIAGRRQPASRHQGCNRAIISRHPTLTTMQITCWQLCQTSAPSTRTGFVSAASRLVYVGSWPACLRNRGIRRNRDPNCAMPVYSPSSISSARPHVFIIGGSMPCTQEYASIPRRPRDETSHGMRA